MTLWKKKITASPICTCAKAALLLTKRDGQGWVGGDWIREVKGYRTEGKKCSEKKRGPQCLLLPFFSSLHITLYCLSTHNTQRCTHVCCLASVSADCRQPGENASKPVATCHPHRGQLLECKAGTVTPALARDKGGKRKTWWGSTWVQECRPRAPQWLVGGSRQNSSHLVKKRALHLHLHHAYPVTPFLPTHTSILRYGTNAGDEDEQKEEMRFR